jgi:hypothetical protein
VSTARHPRTALGVALPTGTPVSVVHVKHPRPDLRYAATVSFDDGQHVAVLATRTLPSVDLGVVRFETGDRFIEHYWRNRWYGILEVHDCNGTLKGWYGNISRPLEVHGVELRSYDLELDLWISADRSQIVRLDEHEFDASGIAEREPAVAAAACRALAELEREARAGLRRK